MALHARACVLPLALVTLVLCSPPAIAQDSKSPVERWVYLSSNFQGEGEPKRAIEIVRRAKAVGYNGVVLADYKLNVLDRVVDRYFKNAAEFKKVCDELGVEIIPAIGGFGYSSGILAHNPDLAEAIPVRDLPMVVRGKEAVVAPELQDPVPGGDFENVRGDKSIGWGFQDGAGKASFIDATDKHGGKNSLRFEELARNSPDTGGNGRVSVVVKVKPWRQYHVSLWAKTQGFAPAGDVKIMVLAEGGRSLNHSNLGVKPDQEWTEHHGVFNSLNHEEVRLYVGCWGGKTGKLWFDDIKLEEVAFLNMVRRDECPIGVVGTNGQKYEEGRDFEKLVDEKMGRFPWAGEFDVWHEPPKLRIADKSRIKDGEKLKVAYFHTVTVYDGQVACSLEHPEVLKIFTEQIKGIERLYSPKTYMLSHDEIRVANWQNGEQAKRSPGEILAENISRCGEIIRAANPKSKLVVWSDMFDPHHNAVKGPYYLVNGAWTDSWKGLPKGMSIMNWNHGKRKESLAHFDGLGHPQILSGYYDHDAKAIAPWLEEAKGLKHPRGAMYTTWTNNYSQLEVFAKAAWGGE